MSSEPIRLLGEHTHVSPGDVFRGLRYSFPQASFARDCMGIVRAHFSDRIVMLTEKIKQRYSARP